MWCPWHQAGGRSQAGKAHPPSRSTRARRRAPEKRRLWRPRSRTWLSPPRIAGRTVASHANRRTTPGLSRTPVSSMPTPSCRVSASRLVVTTNWMGSPPAVDNTSVPSTWRQISTRASARRCGALRPSSPPSSADGCGLVSGSSAARTTAADSASRLPRTVTPPVSSGDRCSPRRLPPAPRRLPWPCGRPRPRCPARHAPTPDRPAPATRPRR
jgi:hypothetical protein